MRVVRFSHNQSPVRYGVLDGESVRPLSGDPFKPRLDVSDESIPLSAVHLLSPVSPSKLLCIGLNYSDHAKESGAPVPDEPLLFLTAPSAIIGPGGRIELSPENHRVDFEAELAVVIKKQTRRVSLEEALTRVFGYTCALDMSDRKLQTKDGQFARAKSFDTFKPIGAWIETEVDPSDLAIQLKQNGTVRQSSRTSQLIFDVPFLVSWLSRIMTLYPGDVILTGTPSGVGPISPQDTLDVTIEKIGTLTVEVAD